MLLATLNGGDGVCISVTWLVVIALILLIVVLALRVLGRR